MVDIPYKLRKIHLQESQTLILWHRFLWRRGQRAQRSILLAAVLYTNDQSILHKESAIEMASEPRQVHS